MRRFFRLSGGGNDFLALVGPVAEPSSGEIRALCHRGLSAGADGLFILERRASTVGMRYFNADGREAELCLNGTRCAVRLATHLGWGDGQLSMVTGAGTFRGQIVGASRVTLDLPRPEVPKLRNLTQDGTTYTGWQVLVGVPHFVIHWPESLALAPVGELGKLLRKHFLWGEQGSNIDFVRFADADRLEIRTFERGVEAETLACGTGVMAATAAGLSVQKLQLPVCALTLGGFELTVGPARSVDDENLWSLTGDARLIAEGTLHPGALELPPPPAWT